MRSRRKTLEKFSPTSPERCLSAVHTGGNAPDQEGPFSHSKILPEGMVEGGSTVRRCLVVLRKTNEEVQQEEENGNANDGT